MKLLIIDDDEIKIAQLISVIVDVNSITLNDITVCKNINEAKINLRQNKYDALLLDMQLPIRDKQLPKAKAGLNFLLEFKNSDKYYHPREIIGITAYEEEFEEAMGFFSDNLLHVIKYDEVSDEWKDRLTERLEYLVSSEEDDVEYDYDIAIICALKSPELDAVMQLITEWNEYIIPTDKTTKYYTSEFNGLKIVAASAAQMGMPASTALAMKLIAFFKPKNLFMTGICAGVQGKVNIGDILVADQSWDYGSGKIKGDGSFQTFQIEPYPLRLSPELKSNVQVLQSDRTFLATTQHNWPLGKKHSSLNIHIGPIGSGSAVIADKSIIEKLLNEQHRKLLGIEMEAYGVMFAAEHSPDPKPKTMVIKSVCDFGDIEKNDEDQAYAAYTSASFLFTYINNFLSKQHI